MNGVKVLPVPAGGWAAHPVGHTWGVLLPVKTVSEANQREHWAPKAKRAKTHRRTAAALCPRATLPAVVTLTRYSAGTLDDDNLRGALKAVRDGIADALGVADNDPLISFRYQQAPAKRGEYAVHVAIEEHTP